MNCFFASLPQTRVILIFTTLLLAAALLRADDWPQWRGLNRDGVWRETGILEAIPAGGLQVRWRVRIGYGYSGPVVAQGRVFVTDRKLGPEVERVLCFEEATGRPLWTYSNSCDYKNMEYGNGPRASPTVHEGKVYTLGTQGHLACLDAASGAVVWKKDLVKEYSARVPQYGASVAPLVEDDLLIVSPGSHPDAVIAFDRHTGIERWKALEDRPAYSAPIAITAGGCRQVIVWTADTVSALEPATGKILWQVPYKATFDPAQAVASPVVHKDQLLCLAAWNRGSLMLKLDADKPSASVLWKTRTRPTTTMSTPLFQDDGHFYAIEGNGSLCCLDAATGDEVWATREPTSKNFGHAHLTPNGNRVFLFNQTGHLILARLTPRGYQELGRCLLVEPTAGFRAGNPVTWAHPAYANQHVFARNDRELVCASLAAQQSSATDSANPAQAVNSTVLAGTTGPEDSLALSLAISPDGQTLALGSGWGTVKILELSTGKALPAPARHNDWVCSVAFSPDGGLLVSAGGSEFAPARNGNMTSAEVKLWDVAAKAERGRLTGHTNKVFSAVFSPDGRTLATGSADQTVRLWDVATMTERAVLKGHTDAISSVAFSKSGDIIASASWDRTVKLWDATTGAERGSLQGHEEEILAVAISPDGRTIATGGADWTVRLWDLATRQEQAVLKGHRGTVYCLAFSADGQTLASGSGDETVKLWNVAARKERTTLRGHKSGVTAVAFAPGDKTLASAGMDDPVRMWEVTSDN
jgi:outer membrane protein assembly factor BamB